MTWENVLNIDCVTINNSGSKIRRYIVSYKYEESETFKWFFNKNIKIIIFFKQEYRWVVSFSDIFVASAHKAQIFLNITKNAKDFL